MVLFGVLDINERSIEDEVICSERELRNVSRIRDLSVAAERGQPERRTVHIAHRNLVICGCPKRRCPNVNRLNKLLDIRVLKLMST